MTEGPTWWVGIDEFGGIPQPGRPDPVVAPNWRLEDVVATERPRHPEVSPDGTRVAFVLDRDSSDVWTIDLPADLSAEGSLWRPGPASRSTSTRPPAAYWADGGAMWSPDGSMLAFTQSGSVCLVPVAGGVVRVLVAGSSPVWLDDRHLVIGVDRDGRTALATIDIAEPWPHRLAAAKGDCFSAVVSPDRSQVAYLVFEHDDLCCTSLHVVEVATGASIELVHDVSMAVRSPAWSPDGSSIVYASEAPGWYEVFVVAATGGSARQLTSVAADFAELAFAPEGGHLVATRAHAGIADLVRIDGSTGDVTVVATGGTWSCPRPLANGSIVAAHEAFDTPPRLCVVGVDGAITELSAPAPAPVRAAPHVIPEHVSYRSSDGLEVHGWLYRPSGVTPDRPCPAVVQPHGGPTSVSGDEWDGIAQYFVDLGYAWFAINPRGSTTYGRDFERANHGVWGVADTLDCLAAHDHLAGLGWVDASRVAIFGASYGSYMALHSVIDDPRHRFACAVAKYGDCDILTSWGQGDLEGRLDLERMMGHPREHSAAYTAGSPIHRVEQLAVPIFVAHGELDDRVHPQQSQELVAALRRLDKQFEYVTYPTEGHGLLRREPFLHFHLRLQRFLDWYLMR
jgi:dipeptidyl aminopeptidase/acylaminoacyl peptidase